MTAVEAQLRERTLSRRWPQRSVVVDARRLRRDPILKDNRRWAVDIAVAASVRSAAASGRDEDRWVGSVQRWEARRAAGEKDEEEGGRLSSAVSAFDY